MTLTNGNLTANRPAHGFISGLLVGGLTGAAVALLLAPSSGEKTRHRLQDKSIELRNQITHTAEDAKTRVEATVVEAKAKAEALEKQAEAFVLEEKERVVRAVEAARTAAQEAWVNDGHSKEAALPRS